MANSEVSNEATSRLTAETPSDARLTAETESHASPPRWSTKRCLPAPRKREVLVRHARGEGRPEYEVLVMRNGKISIRQGKVLQVDVAAKL